MGLKHFIKSLWNSESGDRYFLTNSVDRLGFKSGKNKADLLNYNDLSLYVNRAIDVRAEKVSEIEWVLKNKKGEILEGTGTENPWLTLLNRPNKLQTGKQFWKLWQKYYDITGEAYILKEVEAQLFRPDKVTSLRLLRPDRVTPVFNDAKNDIVGFDYQNEEGIKVRYQPYEIIYAFEPDPQDPYRGTSLIRSGIRAMDTEIELGGYNASILKNRGQVEGIFSFKGDLQKPQMQLMKESYIEQRNNNLPLFLGGDVTYTKLGLEPRELDYLASKGVTMDDLVILTGVPKQILALTSGETFSNADAGITIFLRERIKPLSVNLRDTMDWGLIPDEFDLDFIDRTPEDEDRRLARVRAGFDTGSMSPNERREILGLDPLTGEEYDSLYAPLNLIPLSQSGDFGSSSSEKGMKQKGFNHPLRDETTRKAWGDLQLKRLDSRQQRVLKAIEAYFKGQEKRVLGTSTEKDITDSFQFDEDLELRLAKQSMTSVIYQLMLEAGEDVEELLGFDYNFTFSTRLRTWLDGRMDNFATEITKTTQDKLSNAFQLALDNQEGRVGLEKRIQEVYDGFTKTRAVTIARTETHNATQEATQEGYRQAGVKVKIWVFAAGVKGGVREDHFYLDGEEVPMDMPFSNGLMRPGDGGPEDSINCECSI